jgi:flagellar basal-body rod protein FlgF
MENSGHISLSNQMVMRRQLDVVANNLANITTNGYRAERLVFAEQVRQTQNGDNLSFVQGLATVRDLTEGQKASTGGDLDLAIAGRGFFEVEGEAGPYYTRDGAFRLDNDGELVTRDGHKVMGEGGSPIRLAEADGPVAIAKDGTISAGDGPLGKIKIVAFADEHGLVKLRGGLYDASDESPEAAEDFEIMQGFLEKSNVVGIAEMNRMMQIVQSYKSASKLIDEEHERQRRAIEVLGASMS